MRHGRRHYSIDPAAGRSSSTGESWSDGLPGREFGFQRFALPTRGVYCLSLEQDHATLKIRDRDNGLQRERYLRSNERDGGFPLV